MGLVKDYGSHVRVRLSNDLISLLGELHIYHHRTLREHRPRWVPGDILVMRKDAVIEPFTTIGAGNHLFHTGSFCEVMSQFPINAKIGRYTSVAVGTKFFGFRHPIQAVSTSSAVFNHRREFMRPYWNHVQARDGQVPPFQPVRVPQPQYRPITVGNDVWIGENVRLNGGIIIGDGAVVASDAVVTKDVLPYAIVAGTPAKLIKFRFEEGIRAALSETQWWNRELADLHSLPLADPSRFIDAFHRESANLRFIDQSTAPVWNSVLERLGVPTALPLPAKDADELAS